MREEQWVRIPLRLDQAVLREPPQYQGPGEQLLHFEGDGDGYVLWIRGPAGKQQQVTLKMLLPLAVVGDQTSLRLLAPRATTSELKLTVPLVGAAAKVSEGATLLPPVAGKSETEFTVLGLGGDFELTWFKAGARLAEVPAVLEAVGAVTSRIDSRGINMDATLSVKSYGAAFDRFRVRLPPGAELASNSPSGYAVVAVEQDDPAPPQRLVEVRLAKKTSGPVDVRLTAVRSCDPAQAGQWFELGGFEVVGAARQWGSIAVAVAGDWQVLWGPSRGVRQVDQLPESLEAQRGGGRFRLLRPAMLAYRAAGSQADAHQRGTRVPAAGRRRPGAAGGEAEVYRARGQDLRPGRGPARLGTGRSGAGKPGGRRRRGHRRLERLLDSFAAAFLGAVRGASARPSADSAGGHVAGRTLPQPQASAPESALIAVLPADNVELIPNSKAMVGLVRQQVAAPLELPPREQEPLFYRNEASKAVFAAELRRHARRIRVDVASRLDLDEQGGQVEEKLAYTIAYEPVDHSAHRGPARPGRTRAGWNCRRTASPCRPLCPKAATARPVRCGWGWRCRGPASARAS